jgi:hypothetical protein
VTSVTITDDEEVWKWFAGVFDIRGSIARPVNHPPFVYVSVGGERERAQTILDTIGIGFVVARASRHRTNYMWSCQAKLEVVAVLERTVPHMRTRQGVTRRIIADVKGETPVTRGPP